MARLTKELKQEAEDLLSVMNNEAGRRFVWRQLGTAKIYHDCHTPEDEGARRNGLVLLRLLMIVCPGLYLKMQEEAMSNETRKRIAAENKRAKERKNELSAEEDA